MKHLLSYLLVFSALLFFVACPIDRRQKPKQPKITELQDAVLNGLSTNSVNYCNGCCSCASAGSGSTQYKGKTVTDVDFRGQNIDNWNFEGAKINGCRFDNMTLTGVSFKGATFGNGNNGTQTSFESATLNEVCFVNSSIDSTDFQYATFNAADFRCANITNGKFGFSINAVGGKGKRTNFGGAIIDVGRGNFLFPLDGLTQTNWASTDFSYTKFLGLSPDKFHPAGMDMSDAKIAGINLQNFNMKGVKLVKADLTDATLSFANLSGADCSGAVFTGAKMQTVTATNANFFTTTSGAATFQEADMTYSIMDSSNFQKVMFSGANLSGIKVNKGEFQNAIFSGTTSLNAATMQQCDLSYSDLSNAHLNQVNFSDAVLIGAKFENNSTLNQTNFSDAVLPAASFFNAILQGVNFEGAVLFNANFNGATLTSDPNGNGVNFNCAQLGGVKLGATINKVNFFNAVIISDTSMCCPQQSGVYCGKIPWTGNIYGVTELPDLKTAITCPDGSTAICDSAQWSWSPRNVKLCSNWNSQPPWSKPADCNPHDTTHQVVISDPNLKKCIDKLLFNGQDQPISKAMAATVSAISCPCENIATLDGLESFTGLTYLNVECNDLINGDLSGLSQKLQTVKISDNKLTSLIFNSSQSYITNLEASNNKINQVSGTTNLYFLLLDLSNNFLAGDISGVIQSQSSLMYLDLSNNNLTKVGDLGKSKMPSLASIYLQNNDLTTIGSMKASYDQGNGSLYNLDLQGNNCFDCNSLNLPISVTRTFDCSCNAASCPNCP